MKTKYNLTKYSFILSITFFLVMAFSFFLPVGEAEAVTDCGGGFCIDADVFCGVHSIWVGNSFSLDKTFNCSATFHSGAGGVRYTNLVPNNYNQRLVCRSDAHNITLIANDFCYVKPGGIQAVVSGAPSSVDINELGSVRVSLGVGYFNALDSNMSFNYQIGNIPLVNEASGNAQGWKTFSKNLSSGCPSPAECRFRSNYPRCNGDPLCMNSGGDRFCWDFKNWGYVKIGSCSIKCDRTYRVLAAVTRACCGHTASRIKDVLVTCAPPPSPPPPPPPPTLNVTLNAIPSSGNAPLTSNLSTNVTGMASGAITYSNKSCGGGTLSNLHAGSFRCQYNSAGNYMARIRVNRQGITKNATKLISVNSASPAVNNLKVCANDCNNGGAVLTAISMNENAAMNLRACYNTASECNNATGDVTGATVWTETSSIIDLSYVNPDEVLSAGEVIADSVENFSVVYNADMVNVTVNVLNAVVCGNGDKEGAEECDDGVVANGSCPASCSASCALNDCSGTGGSNWREVAP